MSNRRLTFFRLVAWLGFLAAVGMGADGPPKGPPAPPEAVLRAEAQRIAVMAKVRDAVVAVFMGGGQGGGSGVLIGADGYALTNFHVAQPCGKWMKCGLPDGRVYDAVLVGLDPTGDVALIKLLPRDDFPHVELGDSDQLRAGDWVFAMGNPFLLATDFQPTATYGIVSATHRYQPPAATLLEYTDCIQTDASINPGNSGGPLFDMEGRLVGINGRCSFEKRGRVSVGVGYSISVNQIKNFLGALRSGRIVDHANLNLKVSADESGRVLVADILEQSDAFRRGLRLDDEMVSFGGRAIATPNGFKNVLGIFPKGWRVPMSFRREGKRYDVSVRLSGLHSTADLLEKTVGRPRTRIVPIPKPGEQPQPDKPGGRKDRPKPSQKPAPRPMRQSINPPPEPMPEAVKKIYPGEARLRELLFQQAQSGPGVEGLERRGPLQRAGRDLVHRGRLRRPHQGPLRADRRRRRLEGFPRQPRLGGRRDVGRAAVAGRQRRPPAHPLPLAAAGPGRNGALRPGRIPGHGAAARLRRAGGRVGGDV